MAQSARGGAFKPSQLSSTGASGWFSTRALVRPSGTVLAGSGQRELGQGGAYQLVHQHREQHHVAHHVAVRQLGGGGRHAQRHAGLRQQGDAQILLDGGAAAGGAAAQVRSR